MRLYQAAIFAAITGMQMLSVAVGWEVFEATHDPLALGFVGLVQFLPAVAASFVSGHIADRYDRRRVLAGAYAVQALCGAGLFVASTHIATTGTLPIFALMFLIGISRSFEAPASASLLPQLVPEADFAQAVAWTSSVKQVANILGPVLGGLAYVLQWHGGRTVFLIGAAMAVTAGTLISTLSPRPVVQAPVSGPRWKSLFAGVRYVWSSQLLLGVMTLDLFAVFLGGGVALLPIFAHDLLNVGPSGLGMLRSAPAVGSLIAATFIGIRPVTEGAGKKLLAGIFVFGVATVIMALSRNYHLTFFILLVIGAANVLNVIVRQTLIQLHTPPEMRGRVSAVSQIFNITSNQLGEFESGVTASWWGAVPAVVVGGLGTCLIALLWAWQFPVIRRQDSLTAPERSAA